MNADQGPQMTSNEHIDARPILPASENSYWQKASIANDIIAQKISEILLKNNIEGWARKSQPGEFPYYTVVDLWNPVEKEKNIEIFNRSFLNITITVEPFREHPIIYTVKVVWQKKEYIKTDWELSDVYLEELVKFVVKGGKKPKFFKSKTPIWLLIVNSIVTIIPSDYQDNPIIDEAKPSIINFPFLSWIFSITVILFTGLSIFNDINGNYIELVGGEYFIFLLGIVSFILCIISALNRPVYQAVASQPLRSPRREFMVDSWQISVPEGGKSFNSFKARIKKSITDIDSSIELKAEFYQFLTPRGFESRDRLVLSKDQSNVHLHIQPFGRDAFIGWESYLNWARWSETETVYNVIKQGARVQYKSLEAGAHIPSRFDLMELNALAETIHRNIIREIKLFLEENKIEADLDFKIIRGDRARALNEGNDEDDNSQKEKSKTSRITFNARWN